MKQPKWLGRTVIPELHIRQVREHGGHYGIRDSRVLESALACPMSYWLREPTVGIFMLAAVLGHGLTRNHCFVDGNKRVGFMAMYVFLGVHGYGLDAPEPEVVDLMLEVAKGNVSESALAAWLKQHSVRLMS